MRQVNQFFLATLAILATATTSLAVDMVPWAPNLDAAMNMASRQNRLVLIHFWSPDCAPCRRLEQSVFNRPEVGSALAADFVPVKVNAQQLPETARRFQVDRWPTDVVATPAGYVVSKMGCPPDAQQYVSQLQLVASHHAQQQIRPGSNPIGRVSAQAPPTEDDRLGGFRPSGFVPSAPPQDRFQGQGGFQPNGAILPRGTAQSGGGQGAADFSRDSRTFNGSRAEPPRDGFSPGWGQAQPPHKAAIQPRFADQRQINPQGSNSRTSDPRAATGRFPRQPEPVAERFPAGSPLPRRGSQTAVRGHRAPDPNGTPSRSDLGQADRIGGQAPAWTSPSRGLQSPQPSTPINAGRSPLDASRWSPPAAQQGQVRNWDNPAERAASAPADVAQPQGPNRSFQSTVPGARIGSTAPPPSAPAAPQLPPGNPPLALDGFCAVTLLEENRWQKADPRWGAVHRGRTFLFTGPTQQRTFLAAPDRYSPILAGNDPVKFVEQGQLVSGTRAHGVVYRNLVYLFADEASLERFWNSPQQYAERAMQATQQAQQPRAGGRRPF